MRICLVLAWLLCSRLLASENPPASGEVSVRGEKKEKTGAVSRPPLQAGRAHAASAARCQTEAAAAQRCGKPDRNPARECINMTFPNSQKRAIYPTKRPQTGFPQCTVRDSAGNRSPPLPSPWLCRQLPQCTCALLWVPRVFSSFAVPSHYSGPEALMMRPPHHA